MHPGNIFLTLTYRDECLESPKLIYSHWQTFIKDLRSHVAYKNPFNGPIGTMVTGEYGEKNKRPHWHAILFNYVPDDAKKYRITDRDEQIFTSRLIDDIWGRNDPEKHPSQFGEVTLESAGYVARYAAKKLVHGHDTEHEFHPVHRTSSRNAIGKSWIELYWKHTFENGYIILPNGSRAKIPRYYEDWFKKNHPDKWLEYFSRVKSPMMSESEKKARKNELEFFTMLNNRALGAPYPMTRSKIDLTILELKFKRLQERLKL